MKKKQLIDDEYTDDYLNDILKRKSMKKWYDRPGHSPTPVIGKRVKYKDANWMP